MAVANYFTNYNKNTEPYSNIKGNGRKVDHFENTVEPKGADDAGSTYLLLKNVSSHLCIPQLPVEHSSLTGASDCDIGFYDSTTGSANTKWDGSAFVSGKDLLADGLDLTTANTKVTPKDGIKQLTHEQTAQPIWKLLGFSKATLAKPYYDLVLTINSEVSADGKVTARGILAPVG